MRPATALLLVKLVHTLAWAFFAGCVVLLPIATWLGHDRLAAACIGATLVEIAVLARNGWACPLTALAARYTRDRRDNFDIFLPLWLARYNKQVFGTLFAAGLAYAALRWLAYAAA